MLYDIWTVFGEMGSIETSHDKIHLKPYGSTYFIYGGFWLGLR